MYTCIYIHNIILSEYEFPACAFLYAIFFNYFEWFYLTGYNVHVHKYIFISIKVIRWIYGVSNFSINNNLYSDVYTVLSLYIYVYIFILTYIKKASAYVLTLQCTPIENYCFISNNVKKNFPLEFFNWTFVFVKYSVVRMLLR